MNKKNLVSTVEETCYSIAEELGFELVDVEFIKEGKDYFLRVYIHKPGGITIDDCQEMSQILSGRLDERDPISIPYYLEVSSPGLDRPLKTNKDLKRNLGKDIEIKLYRALEGKKILEGILEDYREDSIDLRDYTNQLINVPRDTIALIKLAVKF